MSRKPNINWRASDAEKLDRSIEKFNAKIYRLRHYHPELKDILPNTIKKADKQVIIDEIRTQPRNEFTKVVNSLDRFLKKGAEKRVVSKHGVEDTKWSVKEYAINKAQLNRDRTRERKIAENMEATSRGVPLGMKRGEMGSERMNELKPKKADFNSARSKKEWEKLKAGVKKLTSYAEKQKQNEQFKVNYIKGLRNVFGGYADNVVSIIEGLPSDAVVATFFSEQEASIDFIYELQEMLYKLAVITDIWMRVKNNLDKQIYS